METEALLKAYARWLGNGSITTIMADRTEVWGPGFQILRLGCQSSKRVIGMMLRMDSQLRRSQSWVGCITSIDLRGLRHDPDEVLAHHTRYHDVATDAINRDVTKSVRPDLGRARGPNF
jgi:hypothetical protein